MVNNVHLTASLVIDSEHESHIKYCVYLYLQFDRIVVSYWMVYSRKKNIMKLVNEHHVYFYPDQSHTTNKMVATKLIFSIPETLLN